MTRGDGPALPLYLTEPGRAMADFGLYLAARPLMPRLPQGDGHPVLVLPGFMADDASTRVLRATLRRLGYRVHGWRLGRNIGPTALAFRGMRDRVDELHERYGRPVTLIGWSLGGIYAREAAKHRPDLVACVATLGSPFSGDRRNNNVWRLYELVARHPVDQPPIDADPSVKPPVPTLALWSRRDGIVAVCAARGQPGECDAELELDCSHMGFAVSGRAYPDIVAAVQDF